MSDDKKNAENRYVNDLRRMDFSQSVALKSRSTIVPIGLSLIFLAFVAIYAGSGLNGIDEAPMMIIIAAVIGGYMAINIGANDVANNMGPAVGGKVLTVFGAIAIAAVCETAGALLAGGDVVKTVSKGIITPGDSIDVKCPYVGCIVDQFGDHYGCARIHNTLDCWWRFRRRYCGRRRIRC
jgi:PiT family inorganic phosphate transporter